MLTPYSRMLMVLAVALSMTMTWVSSACFLIENKLKIAKQFPSIKVCIVMHYSRMSQSCDDRAC